MNVVILGAGRLGGVMGEILKNSANVELWDKVPGLVENQKQLEEIVPKADFLFLCLPSWVLRGAIEEVKPHLKRETIVVSMSKGIEKDSLKTMDEILEDALPEGQRFAFIGGPMMAEEIAKGLGGAGVAATKEAQVFGALDKLFAGPHVYLEHSSDVHSVVLAAVLKNIYSVGLGIAAGLEWGGNLKGWLLVKMLREMREIMKVLGGDPDTVLSLAGLGDVITTGFSQYSQNYRAGKDIVDSGRCCIKSEGTISLPYFLEMLKTEKNNFEFLNVLRQIVIENKNAREVFENLKPN